MFNLSGSEIVFLLIIGLVVLGPEKLPNALRKAGRIYGEFKRIASGAESDFRSAFAEPLRELQDTATGYKSMFTKAASEITDGVKNSYAEGLAEESPEIPSQVASEVQVLESDEVIDGM
ncbi:MAG: twin-arginine translocase TatA/TatE family subunit [Ilumatobacteraceae bacterium]